MYVVVISMDVILFVLWNVLKVRIKIIYGDKADNVIVV